MNHPFAWETVETCFKFQTTAKPNYKIVAALEDQVGNSHRNDDAYFPGSVWTLSRWRSHIRTVTEGPKIKFKAVSKGQRGQQFAVGYQKTNTFPINFPFFLFSYYPRQSKQSGNFHLSPENVKWFSFSGTTPLSKITIFEMWWKYLKITILKHKYARQILAVQLWQKYIISLSLTCLHYRKGQRPLIWFILLATKFLTTHVWDISV